MLDAKFFGVTAAWWLVFVLGGLGLLFGGLNALINRRYRFVDGHVAGVVGHMGSGKSLFMVQRVLLPFCRALRKGNVVSTTHRPVRRVITNFRFDPGMPGVEVRHVEPTSEVDIFSSLITLAQQIGDVEGPWMHPDTGVFVTDPSVPLPYECALCGSRLPDVEACSSDDGHVLLARARREPVLNALVVFDELHLFAGSSKLALGDAAAFAIAMMRKLNGEFWWVSQHEMKVHKRIRDDSLVIWFCGALRGPLTALIGSSWHVSRAYHAAQIDAARRAPEKVRALDRRIYRYTRRIGRIYNSFALIIPDPPSRRSSPSAAHAALRVSTRENDPVLETGPFPEAAVQSRDRKRS